MKKLDCYLKIAEIVENCQEIDEKMRKELLDRLEFDIKRVLTDYGRSKKEVNTEMDKFIEAEIVKTLESFNKPLCSKELQEFDNKISALYVNHSKMREVLKKLVQKEVISVSFQRGNRNYYELARK